MDAYFISGTPKEINLTKQRLGFLRFALTDKGKSYGKSYVMSKSQRIHGALFVHILGNFGFLMRGSNFWPYVMVNISMWASHKPRWVSQPLGHPVGVISTNFQVPFAALRCLKIGLDCHSADFLGTEKIRSCPYLVNNSFRWCTGQNHQYVCLSAWVTLVPMLTPVTSAISTC